MLSATSGTPNSLDVVRLVLSLVQRQEPEIPNALRTHFATVVTQAKQLAIKPTTDLQGVLPESIDLAFEMRRLEALRKHIDTISSVDQLNPALAGQVLRAMEPRAAY